MNNLRVRLRKGVDIDITGKEDGVLAAIGTPELHESFRRDKKQASESTDEAKRETRTSMF